MNVDYTEILASLLPGIDTCRILSRSAGAVGNVHTVIPRLLRAPQGMERWQVCRHRNSDCLRAIIYCHGSCAAWLSGCDSAEVLAMLKGLLKNAVEVAVLIEVCVALPAKMAGWSAVGDIPK